MESFVVYGENVNHAFQYNYSGNTDLSFIALSQYKSMKDPNKGSIWVVPQKYYDPLIHQGLILKKGEGLVHAKNFMNFLSSDLARGIIASMGYGIN